MKLKHYLTISHFIVLVSAIICYMIGLELNNEYKIRTKLKNDLQAKMEFGEYVTILNNPNLYSGKVNLKIVMNEIMLDEEDTITLYTPDCAIIYSNSEEIQQEYISRDVLYQHLNEITEYYDTYTLKEPVFDENLEIVGFYEISIERIKLNESIKQNAIMTVFIVTICMAIIYLILMKKLNKKWIEPLSAVTYSMNQYEKGDTDIYINYNSQDELGELCKHFNSMKATIEESREVVKKEQKVKEYMIATISHDLKTPLTAIRAYAEMLKLSEITDVSKKEEYLEIILSKCDYMKDMLDDLLTYNLLTMNYQLVCVEVEGEEFCEMLYSGVEATCAQKNIQVDIEIEAHGNYKVDVKYMTRVVDNIVSNAIRHTKQGGHIWLGAFSTDVALPDWVDIQCKDVLDRYDGLGLFLIIKNEGTPISEKDKVNLFRPFYQGDEARSKKEHKGVGLGLSISKMIIEKHQGAIEFIPIKDVGNIMVCYLKSTTYHEE